MHTLIIPFLCLVLSVCFPLPEAAEAAVSADLDARNKINLSGRQRMLTQRIAKSACFIFQDVNTVSNTVALSAAHQLFDNTHESLKSGGGDHNLRPETENDVLSALAAVGSIWMDYSQAIQEFEASKSAEAMSAIAGLNVPTLVKMNEAVEIIESHYADGVIDPKLATTINVAGRQRMLTQRAAKELCFLAAGINAEQTRRSLARTVELFDSSLIALMNGDSDHGVVPPVIEDLAWQLESVLALWETVRPIFIAAAETGDVTDTDLQRIAEINDELLKQCNDAVWFYSNY